MNAFLLNARKVIYNGTKTSMGINGILSKLFNTEQGVRKKIDDTLLDNFHPVSNLSFLWKFWESSRYTVSEGPEKSGLSGSG